VSEGPTSRVPVRPWAAPRLITQTGAVHNRGQYFKVHLHHLQRDDPILRLAQPGDVLAIDIVARYQGWVNAVR
jgi:hypothetical protein